MTHTASHIIIQSVVAPGSCELPPAAAEALNNMVENGAYGNTPAEVVRHFICSRLGVDPNTVPDLPEQAADAAVEATESKEPE